ncbi:MAG: DUF4351 domain-containing protein, partial [Rhizonema sp. NSF051]|nr:DUF4351 domain-containing protein [Rhizonema sp. NSF051]
QGEQGRKKPFVDQLFPPPASLLPLPPLLASTDKFLNRTVLGLLSQVAQSIAKISDRDTRQNIAAYTEILAGLRFEKDFIRQLLSEDIMQESVIYQDILQKGEQKEALRFCMFLLNERFGEIDSSIIERVQVLNLETLEALGRALLRISSIADLLSWLDQQKSN